MSRPACLALVSLSLLVAAPANAQFKVEQFLTNNRSLNFSFSSDVRLSRFGQNVIASTKLVAQLRNAQDVIDAMIPELNRRLAGGAGAGIVTLIEIRPRPTAFFGENRSLTVDALFHVRKSLIEGDLTVMVPIDILVEKQQIVLRNGAMTVVGHSIGADLLLVTLPVPTPLVRRQVRGEMGKVNDGVRMVNAWLKKQLIDPLRRQVNTVGLQQLTLQSPQIEWRAGDLRISIEISGQIPVAAADAWLASW